jgi:hypothetical protein
MGQRVFVPSIDFAHFSARHIDRATERLLQRVVAAAMIRVEMGIDDAIEWSSPENTAHQCHGLVGVTRVPGVDQDGFISRVSRVVSHRVV